MQFALQERICFLHSHTWSTACTLWATGPGGGSRGDTKDLLSLLELCDALQCDVTGCLEQVATKLSFKSKVKVKLNLCLTKYHAMKTYWGLLLLLKAKKVT